LAVRRALQAAPLVTDAQLRATLALVRARAALRTGRPHEVVGLLLDSARELAGSDPGRALDLLTDASIAAWQGGDLALYLEVAELGAGIEPPDGDEAAAAIATSLRGYAAMIEGDTETGAPLLRETVAWASAVDDPVHALWGSFASFWLGDATGFGRLVERAAGLARQRGDIGTLAEALGMRSTQLAFEQRLDDASIAAEEAVRLARELGGRNLEVLPRAALTVVAAARGNDEEARRQGEEVLRLAAEAGLRLRASAAVHGLALSDLAHARWEDALVRLDSLLGPDSALDPLVYATLADKIEAAVRAGRPEEGRAVLPLFERRVEYSGLRAAVPRLASCRALLSEGEEAAAHWEEAMAGAHDARPLDLARMQLLYGEYLRRERRRADARVQLRGAIEGFERLGAESWAERARVELRASGETARKRDPSTISNLTPQELQIAQLVAEGMSNKEIAAQLYLSPRTIDSHLRNVFSKLAITSRVQLARLSLGTEAPADTASAAAAPA
jgi:ATP/maltotriose-dependent transcriptional regulator MalT